MAFYNKSVEAVIESLNSSEAGLTEDEAAKRLKLYGKNLIKIKGEPLWKKLAEPFVDVFMLVLFIAVVISFIYGDILDAVIILFIMAVSVVIYYVQRFSTEKILRSLQKHNKQTVDVVRAGRIVQIDSSMIVPGDIIHLYEGDKVPADLRLISGESVQTNESVLTGESMPVSKSTHALTGTKEVYAQKNILFEGSFIVSGNPVAIVTDTGNSTTFGKIAALAEDTNIQSPVQQKINKLLRQVISVVAAVAVVAFILAIARGTEMSEALRFVMALSVSAVPEGLPVAIPVILALGMRRMAAKKALVRTMRSIETVGIITTIATDKTGTLTQNKLTLKDTWQLKDDKGILDEAIMLSTNGGNKKMHDPLDIAMDAYSTSKSSNAKVSAYEHVLSLPFDQSVAMSGNIWKVKSKTVLYVKGAPERIIELSNLTQGDRQAAEEALRHLTSLGYRVVAAAELNLPNEIKTFQDIEEDSKFDFAGLFAVADELRPQAKRAITAAVNAGVTVRMITGDHFETAYQIGKELGMVKYRSEVFDSRKMSSMSDQELLQTIDTVRVFSRVIPENKYRILSLLKERNITAMTGDGVNDVPALANAHVGIAMGSGSQIAKDAGDIILLDDNFKTIIDAMREGRAIFSNIRRMLYYLLATNTGEVLLVLSAMIAGLPIPLLPVQILWVNLVTDTAMVIPLGVEPEEEGSMRRKPRKPTAPIFNKYMIIRILVIAVTMAIVALSLYIIFYNSHGYEYARTAAFTSLVVMQWSNAFNARSDLESVFTRIKTWSTPFLVGLIIAISLQGLATFGPLQDILHITEISTAHLLLVAAVSAVVPILTVELHKLYGRKTKVDVY
jgi:Ca2+-transporting ATPase